MATLSGNVNRGRVVVVHQQNHIPVFDVTPDANGDWSADVPAGEPFMVIYIDPAGDCAPEIHGPYFAETPA